jgi:hypothetical protein
MTAFSDSASFRPPDSALRKNAMSRPVPRTPGHLGAPARQPRATSSARGGGAEAREDLLLHPYRFAPCPVRKGETVPGGAPSFRLLPRRVRRRRWTRSTRRRDGVRTSRREDDGERRRDVREPGDGGPSTRRGRAPRLRALWPSRAVELRLLSAALNRPEALKAAGAGECRISNRMPPTPGPQAFDNRRCWRECPAAACTSASACRWLRFRRPAG